MNKPYRMGIDCRFWGVKHAGLGRYTRELVSELLKLDCPGIEFTLFFQTGDWEEDRELLKNHKIVEVNIPHYSLKEQLFFGRIVDKEKLDLIHFAHFNVPVFVSTPFIVTIHDLIKHFFKGRPVTTRNAAVYWLKYGGYRFTIDNAIRKSKSILTPSIFTKDQISVHYPGTEGKINVTYEGVSENYLVAKTEDKKNNHGILKKYNLSKPFFIYTGSAYPSKDIPTLLKAFKLLNKEDIRAQLIIACARNVFWERLNELVRELDLSKNVILPGRITDEDLVLLYKEAAAFVMPSLMEGFGLPALEAMAAGCPVISSDAGSLPEIYEDGALYFTGGNPEDLEIKVKKILSLSDSDRKEQIEKAKNRSDKFRWKNTARETLKIYQKVLEKITS